MVCNTNTVAERRLAYRGVLNVGLSPTPPPSVARPLGLVNIIYGPHDLDLALAGLTVEEIQLSLRDVLGVPMDAQAFHNGVPVEDRGMVVGGGRRRRPMRRNQPTQDKASRKGLKHTASS